MSSMKNIVEHDISFPYYVRKNMRVNEHERLDYAVVCDVLLCVKVPCCYVSYEMCVGGLCLITLFVFVCT